MSYSDKHIKIDASKRELNKKIKNLITDSNDEIFWYIRFNLPLDEKTVSEKTMKVTDTDGHIIKTKIIYNKDLELIIITPLEKFEKNQYYILHISKKLKSESNKKIKDNVHILFKIKEGQLVDFEEIAENIKVPKPVPPTKEKLKEREALSERIYSFDNEQKEKLEEAIRNENLPYISLKINPTLALIGSLLFFIGIFLNITILATIGIFLSIIGFTILFVKMNEREFKSKLFYNMGVYSFNRKKFKSANKIFKKSVNINHQNELAEYAYDKSSNYL